jgi:hypothetical protein
VSQNEKCIAEAREMPEPVSATVSTMQDMITAITKDLDNSLLQSGMRGSYPANVLRDR